MKIGSHRDKSQTTGPQIGGHRGVQKTEPPEGQQPTTGSQVRIGGHRQVGLGGTVSGSTVQQKPPQPSQDGFKSVDDTQVKEQQSKTELPLSNNDKGAKAPRTGRPGRSKSQGTLNNRSRSGNTRPQTEKPQGPSPEPMDIRAKLQDGSKDRDGRVVQKSLREGLKDIKDSKNEQSLVKTKEGQLGRLRSREGKTGHDTVELQPGGEMKMKELHEKSRTGEKEQPSQTVTSTYDPKTGKSESTKIEVKEKDWQGGQQVTRYFSEKEKQQSEVKFGQQDHDQSGQMNVRLMEPGKPGKPGKVQEGGEKLFVMDGEGKVYSGKQEPMVGFIGGERKQLDTHHSSFLSGESVAGAGTLTTRKDGTLGKITDQSGHYQPGSEQTLQTVRELERKGVSMENVKFGMVRGTENNEPKELTGMVRELQQGGGSETTFRARHEVTNELKKRMQDVRNDLDDQSEDRRIDVNDRVEQLKEGKYESSAPKSSG